MLEWFERRLKSSYLKMLEGENQRLRDELRQLTNSLLTASGLMPIVSTENKPATAPLVSSKSWGNIQRRLEQASFARATKRSAAIHAPTEAGKAS